MSIISTTVDNLIIRRIVGTAIENAVGYADPIGEQGVECPQVHKARKVSKIHRVRRATMEMTQLL